MKKLIFVFILISFGFSFAGWIHYFPQVIYGVRLPPHTGRFSDKICVHKITTVGDDIIIAFARGKAFTRLIRMDKHGRITDDLFFGYYDLDTTVHIQPMGLERGLRSYLELYFTRRTIPSSTWETGVLYFDSSLTVTDELIFDYGISYLGGDICRVDSSYIIGGIVVSRINFDGDTIWHLDMTDTLPDYYGVGIAVSPDKKFAFVCVADDRPDEYITTKVAKLDLDSGTVLWTKTGLRVGWISDVNKNYFALYPTPDGGLFHFSRSTGRHSVYYYYPSSGDEYRVQPESGYGNFRFWCFTPIDSNLFWAGGAFKYGSDSTFAAIAKVRLEGEYYRLKFRFIYMKTFPIRGFVEKIIPFDDSLIIAGIGDAYVGEYSNYYFVMKTDTLGNTGIAENRFPLPASPKMAVCPNPFNRACRITYPYDEKWSVKIYNTKGRLVYESGEISGKSFVWQPEDKVESGLYIVVAGNEKRNLAGKVFFVK